MFFTLGNDRLFPGVKNMPNKENILYVRHVKHAAHGPHVVCGPHDNTNVIHMAIGGPSVWHACSTVQSHQTLSITLWRLTKVKHFSIYDRQFHKTHWFLEDSEVWYWVRNMVVWQWQGKAEVLAAINLIYYRSHTRWPGLEHGPPRRQPGDYSP
jgi:hypothetical protein